jgi:putative nucleotidyltransferase with HDIG domain
MRDALRQFLARLDFEVVTAASGEAALKALEAQPFGFALFDVNLPGMSGMDLVQEAMHLDRHLAIVMLSGQTEAVNATICLHRGAMDYLTKPVQLDALERALQRAARERQRRLEEEEVAHYLREEVAKRSAEVRVEQANLERLALGTLSALVTVQEAGDPYLAGHSIRVAEFAASMAAQLGRSDDQIELVRRAGLLHDLGMIAVPSAILRKQGQLLEAEFEEVKKHPAIGHEILAPLPGCEEIARFVRHHHERWDGQGYPDGTTGIETPWGARLLAAAEVYDALTSARPYQEQLGPEAAVARMMELSGTLLDPAVFDALRAVVRCRKTLTFVADQGQHGEPLELRGPGAPLT